MVVAKTLLDLGRLDRQLYLFDTFFNSLYAHEIIPDFLDVFP
jgi:hypothetical protein